MVTIYKNTLENKMLSRTSLLASPNANEQSGNGKLWLTLRSDFC